MRVVLPAPLGPIRATRWPRSMAKSAPAISVRPATAMSSPSASRTTRPLRAGGGKRNPSARCCAGRSSRSMRAIAFSLLWAWRAFVP